MPTPKGLATIGTNNPAELLSEGYRKVPTMRAATFGDKLRDFQLSLMDNPAIQALGLFPNPGESLAIGPFSPEQRLERLRNLKLGQVIRQTNGDISTEVLNRGNQMIQKYPRISAYLNDIFGEKKQSWNGSLSSLKQRPEIASTMSMGPKTRDEIATAARPKTDEKLFRMRVKPRKSGDTTDRHEYGHLARWIKNPESMAKSGVGHDYAQSYGYWLNPEEIRARAIAAKGQTRPNESWDPNNSYPKNDYMMRLKAAISEGLVRSTPNQRNRFFADVNRYFPWYDSVGGTIKPGVPIIK